MRVSFYTLGCKVNQNETGALAQLFRQNGYTLAGPDEEADVFVVNSCTVTAGGDKKSRQWLRRAKRQYPGAVTVLTGCYPQAFPEEAAAVMEADVVMGNANRHAILRNVDRALEGERVVDIAAHEKGEAFEELPMERFEGHTRAFIKVQDGCNRQCAYCVIPRARGRVRSRSEASILKELEALAAAGYKEVVFSGINLPSYGQDTGTNLIELIEHSAQVEGIERIRLGSLEPDLLSDDDIARMARTEKLCPQFHLSLQSGCTATLRRMRRVYTAEEYAAVVKKLRAAYNGACSFTTDVIVGFPGETEEEFAESVRFVQEMEFLKVHVFPYSRREGTPAATFPDQIPEEEKARRVHILQTAADEVRGQLANAWTGSVDTVLLEKPLSANLFTGYTRLYLPVVVSAPGAEAAAEVRVSAAHEEEHRSAQHGVGARADHGGGGRDRHRVLRGGQQPGARAAGELRAGRGRERGARSAHRTVHGGGPRGRERLDGTLRPLHRRRQPALDHPVQRSAAAAGHPHSGDGGQRSDAVLRTARQQRRGGADHRRRGMLRAQRWPAGRSSAGDLLRGRGLRAARAR